MMSDTLRQINIRDGCVGFSGCGKAKDLRPVKVHIEAEDTMSFLEVRQLL